MSNAYLVAIAGNVTTVGGVTGPSVVDVTMIPEYCWPVVHAAFGVDDLTGKFMYTPAAEAAPVIEAAIQTFHDRRDQLAELVHPNDWRGLDGNRRVLERMLQALHRYPDNVIAWGVA